ncbi:hypothetical protein FRY74_03090 [Vicingus serpentipes]|jgi:hypothetical protein|uniref:DUF4177 domain-containing protein n=1 Tax=Vicingus serpentipes TaxID=1926625 RepID=A0A5C6RYZ2_9FLAO|nr:hypothetical protein [Vicingus serpentipes]TXB67185.1 hypothetical protein FRY74_03090 [Vicingus serpentipes]
MMQFFKIKSIIILIFCAFTSIASFAQDNEVNIVSKLKSLTKKGDYAILEVRLNNEDEFRTTDGSTSSLARLAVFTGNNNGAEVISKGFNGMNSIVSVLNTLKSNGWRLVDVYSLKGESLIITHYVIERKK